MKSDEFIKFIKEDFNDGSLYRSLINEESNQNNEETNKETQFEDCNPGDIQLDKIITISQQLQDNTIKSFDFIVVEVWLKPNNMYTIVNVKKEKEQKNFWILFYMDNCFYLKKGIKGPIGVHCKIKNEQVK